MPNRSIEAKRLKMKRRGKSRVYGLQFVNTGSGPAPGAINSLYRHKLVDDGIDLYLAAKFPGRRSYTAEELIARNEFDKEKAFLMDEKENPVPLGEVKLLLQRLQREMNETVMSNHMKVTNKSYWQQDLFFNASKTCWMIIEMMYFGADRFVRRSETYSSQSLARQALTLQAVRWVETVPLQLAPHTA